MRKIYILTVFVSLFTFVLPSKVSAQAVDIREYIAGTDFVPHTLSTGESVYFTGDGGEGPGTPVRQYKNANYEQFFIGDTVYRREDTSWAPLEGWGDAYCSNGNKAVYLVDPGCVQYAEGQSFSSPGSRWGPTSPYITVGQSWSQGNHQIVTIDSGVLPTFNYCKLSNLGGYDYAQACNQTPVLYFSGYFAPGEYEFCTGITNVEPLISLSGTAGAGAGDGFLYMKGWGLVGFEDANFQVGLLGPGADASNCRGGGTGQIPSITIPLLPPDNPPKPPVPEVPIPYTPCNETRDEEFHSLRPYPASPCDDEPKSTVTMCANTFTARQVFEVTYDNRNQEADSCTEISSREVSCQYTVNSTVDVSIWPALTRLPIVGNTELVPNSKNSENQLDNATRMNEYASWYLNGVTSRAEEDDEYTQNILRLPILTNADIEERINEVINFSGPIKKLLPYAVQNNEVNFILGGIQNPTDRFLIDGLREQQKLDAKRGGIRHNQIVVCTASSSPNFPIPCYNSDRFEYRRRLLSGEMDYFWLDRINPSFSFIPFSSTEDILGQIRFDYTGAEGSVNVTSVSPNLPSTPNKLSLPHLIETRELGNILQKTFTSLDFLQDNAGEANIAWREVLWGEPPLDQYAEQQQAKDCTILETRTNPGDLVYGIINTTGQANGNPEQQGQITYSAQFNCTYILPVPDQECVNICMLNEDCFANPSCNGLSPLECAIEACTAPPPSCQQYIDLKMDVSSTTPLADNLWDKFVAGNYSIFKRIFPRVGPNSPVSKILDIPAKDTLRYDASSNGDTVGLVGTGAIAGDTSNLKRGADAEIYYPHIGSVHEYFLKGIQKALRPYGVSNFQNTPIGPTDGTPQICSIQNSAIQSQELLNIIASAARWANIPVELLITVVRGEGCGGGERIGGICQYSDTQVLEYSTAGVIDPRNCPQSGSKGPLQMYEDSVNWDPWKNAVNMATGEGRDPQICNLKDAIYAGAYRLSAGYDGCPNPGFNVSSAPNPSSWTDNQIKLSLTSWASGCLDAGEPLDNWLCQGVAAGFYCTQYSVWSNQIVTDCN